MCSTLLIMKLCSNHIIYSVVLIISYLVLIISYIVLIMLYLVLIISHLVLIIIACFNYAISCSNFVCLLDKTNGAIQEQRKANNGRVRNLP
jgi:hypothetical protein